ncbi:MAG: helix-turn-helix domain-containing protein [Candidatus Thermoplasmatota archaeon]|nr:helix-turn-helix domain-containing protein [Candidatus Thermoplasmatota archaeon]
MRRTKIELDRNSVLELENIVKKGKRAVREVNRARILLLSNSGKRNDEIAETLCVNRNTVLGVKKRYLKCGLAGALHDGERSGQPKKYREKESAEIIALACSSPPHGRKRWSIRLIVEEMKKKKGFEGINRESVRLILKNTTQNHGKEECGASGP